MKRFVRSKKVEEEDMILVFLDESGFGRSPIRGTDWAMIHRYYGKKVMMVMDRLPTYLSSANYFMREHSDWFEFVYLPSYVPEMNLVEQYWNHMKHVLMSKFVPLSFKELTLKTLELAVVMTPIRN